MKRTIGRMALAAAVMTALCAGQAWADDELPEGLKGFSGQVRGVVKGKGDGNTFAFKVGRVLRVWKNNEAETPRELVGRQVSVGPRWVKGEDGKWRPMELHVAFIRKLKVGQELTLEIRNEEGNHFNILELTKEQRQWAARAAEGEGDRPEREGDKPSREAETQRVIKELRAEIERLKAENAELRKRIERIEALLK